MKIIGIADIHGHINNIKKLKSELKSSDLLLIAGDITNFGAWGDCDCVLSEFYKYCKNIFAVFGNCDTDDVIYCLTKKGINLHNNKIIYNGYSFIGLGGSLPCPAKTPTEYSEDKINILLRNMENNIKNDEKFIFVTHHPPFNTKLDIVYSKKHVGCLKIREFIERNNPVFCLCGHIHESKGMDKINDTLIFNPGPFASGGYLSIELENGKILNAELKKI